MKGIEYIKTKKNYTTEEVFDIMKNQTFRAGKPELKIKGSLKSIKLPAVGRYCIKVVSGGNRVQLAMVQDTEQVGTLLTNNMIGRIFGIFAGLLDKDKKPSLEILTRTTEELRALLEV